jgi:hypothetical protein
LARYGSGLDASSAPRQVINLAQDIRKRFQYFNLSAASKLLWLKCRSPIVILDARAAKALRGMNYKFDARDYNQYYGAWGQAFLAKSGAIKAAIGRLPDYADFSLAAKQGRPYIRGLITENWFVERVFDLYLWNIGEP